MPTHPPNHRDRVAAPSAPPRSVARAPELLHPSPVSGAWFLALRSLKNEFSKGGIAPRGAAASEEQARSAVFQVLDALFRVTDVFARAVIRREPCSLVVR